MSGPNEGDQGSGDEFAAMGRQKPVHEVPPPEPPGAVPAGGSVEPPTYAPPPAFGLSEPVHGGESSPPPPPLPPPPPPPAAGPEGYPMRFDIEYPERLSRLSTFFRGFLIIPVWFFLYLVQTLMYAGMPAGWITVFFRKRYPRWLFAANSGALGFEARAWAYAMLLTDKYPSFDVDASPVTLEFDDPPQGALSRWRVLFWKGVLLIPHVFVLTFLMVGVVVVVFLSWWAILFTGRYPRGMFGFVTGVSRWYFRVLGYFASFNDRYPPFALSAEAGPAANTTVVINGIIGGLATGGLALLIVLLAIFTGDPHVEAVDYGQLERGVAQGGVTVETFDGDINTWLAKVTDPGDELVPLLTVSRDERVVVFTWEVQNESDAGARVNPGEASLKVETDGEAETYEAVLIVAGGAVAPAEIEGDEDGTVEAVFIIPEDAVPVHLLFTADFLPVGGIRYEFE